MLDGGAAHQRGQNGKGLAQKRMAERDGGGTNRSKGLKSITGLGTSAEGDQIGSFS